MPAQHQHRADAQPTRYRVLLVDDDAAVLRSMAAMLELDLDVETCNSGERALELLKSADFDVVCTDYSMPGMTGIELLERVQRLPRAIGCLLVTGASEFMGRNGSGTTDHYVLMKPVDPARLSTLVAQLARTAKMKRATSRAAR